MNNSPLPLTLDEARTRGWDELDIVFVSGDAYIDHPSFGVPLLARLLESKGFRVGIISQPDWRLPEAFRILGRPRLFFAVASGAMDSMVAHYTPARKIRRDDAYTPGNRHGSRPNRAVIVYTSCCKAAYREVPVVIGGIEASLRRFAHYDYWDDAVRRSIIFDAKADLLIYGMAEHPLVELAQRLRKGESFADIRDIRGTAYIGKEGGFETRPYVELPSYEEVSTIKQTYAEAFRLIDGEQNPYCAKSVVQRHGDRYLVCNPPSLFPPRNLTLSTVSPLPRRRIRHTQSRSLPGSRFAPPSRPIAAVSAAAPFALSPTTRGNLSSRGARHRFWKSSGTSPPALGSGEVSATWEDPRPTCTASAAEHLPTGRSAGGGVASFPRSVGIS